MNPTIKCPSCGAQTSGKFCSECGQPTAGRSCPSCGASLSAKAKFCPECGTTALGGAAPRPPAPGLVPTPASGLGDKFPWIIAGIAVLALLVTVILVVTKKSPAAGATAAAAIGDPNRATTDLSAMTPREAADRLYERVARAAAAGDTAQVQFFGPMTLQAYASITPLDADARLHLGLVELNMGNAAAALAQADSIAQGSRTHLFASVLRAQTADQQRNTAAARTAYQAFLRNYDAEKAKNLPEYQQHEALLGEVRTAAQAAVGAAR